MSKVTIGLIQLETRLGDKEYNLALAQEKVREAAAQGAKIICLPELFVTGSCVRLLPTINLSSL